MRTRSWLMLLVLGQGGGALAEETPSPALLVLNKATGTWKPTQGLSYCCPSKDEGDLADRFSGTDVNQHGIHHGRLRRLASFGGATAQWIPTPLVPG